MADEIAAAKIPTSVILIDSPGGKLETTDLRLKTPAITRKGRSPRRLSYRRQHYRFALVSAYRRPRCACRNAAGESSLRNDDGKCDNSRSARPSGSLEAGKDADFIVLSGDPLSVYTHVMQTWIEGKKVFDRNDPKDHLIAVGGVGAGNDGEVEVDCFDGDLGGENQ